MRHLFVALAIALATSACSTDPGQTPSPATPDMASARDQSTPPEEMEAPDQSAIDMNAARDMTGEDDLGARRDMTSPEDMTVAKEMGARDMSVEDMSSEDMSVEDMAVDMGADMPVDMGPLPDRPAGQCASTADCGHPDLTCNRDAVGGSCQGPCDACNAIPGPDTYTCVSGACVRECDGDDECPLGKYCSRGRCLIQRCSGGVCPTAIFGCTSDDGICQRKSCAMNEPCPQGTACTDGVCIEQ